MNVGIPIAPLDLRVEVPLDRRVANAQACRSRGLPSFTELPDYAFGRIRVAALVSGGPSAGENLDKIREFKTVFACGSVHDWLITQGIIPKYCVIFDPGPAHAMFYRRPQADVTYLVCATCDPAVFDVLAGQRVHVWAPYDDTPDELYGEGTPRVNGGSSVTLRTIPLAHVLGYREQHLFGFDCCHLNGDEHAYEHGARGDRITVSFMGKQFSTTPQLLQQSQEFLRMYTDHQHMLMCKVAGDGLIATIMRESVCNYG